MTRTITLTIPPSTVETKVIVTLEAEPTSPPLEKCENCLRMSIIVRDHPDLCQRCQDYADDLDGLPNRVLPPVVRGRR